MASSLYKISSTKSSVSHTTNSEALITDSSDSDDDKGELCLGYSSPPISQHSNRRPIHFMRLLSSNSHDLDFYKSKFQCFVDYKLETYALTISPKSTPLMKNKTPHQQEEILKRILFEAIDEVEASVVASFEFYTDMTDIHMHGFLTVKKVKDLDHIKRSIRNTLFRGKPPTDARRAAVPVQIKKQGRDMRVGWLDYCTKDAPFMIKNNFLPIYKIRF